MANLKFAPDLFLELQELNFFKDSLDTNGFRKNILENSVNYGLIKSNKDISFANGKITQDTDLSGDKTVKIALLAAIDQNGNFLYSGEEIRQIVVPNDGNWRWLKVSYATSNKELGTVSIDAVGNVTGVGTEFTKMCRGIPNFPSKIKFLDAVDNTLEYQVLEVISDTQMILQNPAVDLGGLVEFAVESDLTWGIVGTFTPGIAIPSPDKYLFVRDSITYTLVSEITSNTRPTYVAGTEFFLARVKCTSGTLVIQDKRTSFWETKGSELAISIDRNPNPLIGVEAVKWMHPFSPADKNIVEVAWTFRTANWSINTNQNILTLASGEGGRFKSVSDFTDGDFDGWRVYTDNEKYSIVVSSYTLSGAINLVLDTLDVDNYSTDGGTTPIAQTVVIAPDCEEVSFWCQAHNGDGVPSVSTTVTFPTYHALGKIELECYKDPSCAYNIQYSYKSFKEATGWELIPSDTVSGYLNESSFDEDGVLGTPSRTTYTSAAGVGFIVLTLCPWSLENFRNNSFIGDNYGVNVIATLGASALYNLVVGTSKQYQYVAGSQTISADTVFDLSTSGAVEGNEFRIHLNCSSLTIGANTLRIKSGVTILKDITVGDIYCMMNREWGIVFTCKYTGSAWIVSQNYELGSPSEIKMIDGTLASLFDVSGGVPLARGKVRGLYGWVLCYGGGTVDGVTIPDLSNRFLVGHSGTKAAATTGGNDIINLTVGQLAAHDHDLTMDTHDHDLTMDPHGHRMFFRKRTGASGSDYQTVQVDAGNNGHLANEDGSGADGTLGYTSTAYNEDVVATGTISSEVATGTIDSTGSGDDIDITPKYYSIIYCKKLF